MSLSFAAVSYIGAVVGEVWTQVAVSVDQVNGSVVFYQNGASTTSQTLITSHIDSPDSIKQIGVGYQGFMYSICITHSAVDTFLVDTNCEGTLGTGYAPASPQDACLLDVGIEDYLSEDGSIQPCTVDCPDGCRYPYHCRQCDDLQCEGCTDYSVCDVDGCINDAVIVADDCQCQDPNPVYFLVDAVCGVCLPGCQECDNFVTCITCFDSWYLTESEICEECHSRCSICLGPTFIECQDCNDPFVLLTEDDICNTDCPTGYTEADGNCNLTSDIMCITLDDKDWITKGSNNVALQVISGNPLPIYDRGLYLAVGD